MFFIQLKRGFGVLLEPIVDHFIEKGYHPDTFTILGLFFNIIAAALYAVGLLFEGGLVMLFGSSSDLIDGQIARRGGQGSAGGALLDSSLDRYSEIVVLLGLIVHYMLLGWFVTVAATVMAMAGSLMVSYVRARAEGLNYDCNVGLMQRPERIVFLCACSVFGAFLGSPDAHVAAGIWVMAILTNITTFDRIMHVRRVSRLDEQANNNDQVTV
jgi:CDP-diacylglycerol---glycerol-3-phosphate 3-phosphatidyltransferase